LPRPFDSIVSWFASLLTSGVSPPIWPTWADQSAPAAVVTASRPQSIERTTVAGLVNVPLLLVYSDGTRSVEQAPVVGPPEATMLPAITPTVAATTIPPTRLQAVRRRRTEIPTPMMMSGQSRQAVRERRGRDSAEPDGERDATEHDEEDPPGEEGAVHAHGSSTFLSHP